MHIVITRPKEDSLYLKLCDFGTGKFDANLVNKGYTPVSTVAYMPPEIYQKVLQLDEAIDIWQLCASFGRLVSQHPLEVNFLHFATCTSDCTPRSYNSKTNSSIVSYQVLSIRADMWSVAVILYSILPATTI